MADAQSVESAPVAFVTQEMWDAAQHALAIVLRIADYMPATHHREAIRSAVNKAAAAQFQESEPLRARLQAALHQCAFMALDSEDPASRQKQDNARQLLRDLRLT